MHRIKFTKIHSNPHVFGVDSINAFCHNLLWRFWGYGYPQVNNLLDQGIEDYLADAVLLVVITEQGSMNRAAAHLGTSQNSVSRRVQRMEDKAGGALFVRSPSGVIPTPLGTALLPAAKEVMAAGRAYIREMRQGFGMGTPVAVAAPEGLATYLVTPALMALTSGPAINLLDGQTQDADIEIILVEPGQPICRPAGMCAKKVGRMAFAPMASAAYLRDAGMPDNLIGLTGRVRLTHPVYDGHSAFAVWTEIIRSKGAPPLMTVPTSSALHRGIGMGGIALLPDFAPAIDPNIAEVICGVPPISVDIYLVASPDLLRMQSIRFVYDWMGDLFIKSKWFQDK